MKFYSETLKKFFDTEASCLEAEEQYKKEQEELVATQNAVSKEKKQLAKKIEECDSFLEDAYSAYELAKEEAKKILEESNKQVENLLNPAYQNIKEAQKKKFEALQEFNRKYGAYTTIYNGDRARQEFQRASKFIEDLFKDLW